VACDVNKPLKRV